LLDEHYNGACHVTQEQNTQWQKVDWAVVHHAKCSTIRRCQHDVTKY